MHNCVHPGFLLEINFVFCACICLSFYVIIGLSCNCFCVVYTKCKPCYFMMQDTYSSLDLSWWTERLSCGLLLSKVSSGLCWLSYLNFKASESDHFAMVAVTRCQRSFFLSSFSFIFVDKISHAGFPTVSLSSKSGLQCGVVLLTANISWSGPLVLVAPRWNLGVIIDSLCGHISRKSFTGTFFILNFCLYHMLSKKIT